MSNASDDTTLNMQELYNKHKGVVWVIKINHTSKGKSIDTIGTAFSVSNYGLILSSAHLLGETRCTITVRRLDEVQFHSAKVVYKKRNWDVMLLQVLDVNNCQHAMFTDDGSLSVGQTVWHIGNPGGFVGSVLEGKVGFKCVEDVKIPVSDLTCETYITTATITTPGYRIMGDIWNEHVFENPSYDGSFEKNLHPFVPIIQIYGLIGGAGCSGGPIFNVKGEIVGMFAMDAEGYQVAIHVAILRETLIRFLKKPYLDNEDVKRKDVSDHKIQGGDSKKFKIG